MKIYRFLPNGKDFRHIPTPSYGDGVIGPLGISLRNSGIRGEDLWFPESHEHAFARGPVKAYDTSAWAAELPLSDFPAFALNVPVISERVVSLLRCIDRLPRVLVPVTVDGVRYFAVKHTRERVCDRDRSAWIGVSASHADHPAFCYRRAFDVSKISGEFFSLGDWYKVSDCYITSVLVDEARNAGLTGLEYVELVHDEQGPVIPIYPRHTVPEQIDRTDACRLAMERQNLSERCLFEQVLYDIDVRHSDLFEELVARGLVSVAFTQPSYERSLEPLQSPEPGHGQH